MGPRSSDRQQAATHFAANPERGSRHLLSAFLVVLAGVCLSSGGVLVRHLDTSDGWLVLVVRSAAFSTTVLAFLAVSYRGHLVGPFRRIGYQGAVIALALGTGFIFYLFGLLLTTVANVVFVASTSPFFAALFGWLALRERVRPFTLFAIVAAMIGIGIMFADGLVSGHWLGNLVALGAPVTAAIMIVAIRRSRAVDMMPAVCLAGIVTAVISAPLVGSWSLSPHDLVLCLLMGTVQVGGGFILITLGARYLPAAEVALLALSEAVLAPIWVWWAIGEVPRPAVLAGGAIVLIVVAMQALLHLRLESQRS
jgi:drug/metabolite transporter (DMT)-like permease